MSSASEFIENFLAHSEYDPQKAHEYYLRTRELRGRNIARTTPAPLVRKGGSVVKPSPLRRTPKTMTAEQHRKEIEAKVEALKVRLETLRKVLAELVKQAQARSGKETTDSKESDKTLTPKQKKAASEASQKYYEEHKNDQRTPSEQLTDLQSKVKSVQTKIEEMRKKLKEPSGTMIRKPDSVGVRTLKR